MKYGRTTKNSRGRESNRKIFNHVGYTTIKSLKDANPAQMYEKECLIRGQHIDRCQLYVYRCAVYFASTENPEPEKLKWWYWKD